MLGQEKLGDRFVSDDRYEYEFAVDPKDGVEKWIFVRCVCELCTSRFPMGPPFGVRKAS